MDNKETLCFRCTMPGHIAVNCTNGKSFVMVERVGGDRRNNDESRVCRRCKGQGHIAKNCPEDTGAGKKEGCFTCGSTDHFARDCKGTPFQLHGRKERNGS